MMKKLSIIVFFMVMSFAVFAGTLIFKDGTRLSGIEIISISDGEIIIEKDKAKRTYSVSKIKSFYQTDLAESSNEVPGDFSDYKVKILDLKVPKNGYDSNKKTTKVEIQYSISRTGKISKIKVPYFYFYVITPGKNEVSGRQVHRYYYPKNAKPKGKDYDEAAILAELADFGRPVWNSKNRDFKGNLNGRTVTIDLKGVGKRDILAWHLEVWGNDTKLIDKTQDMMQLQGRRVGKNWWKRHEF